MNIFKENKILLIVIITVCAIIVMWGRSFVIKKGIVTPGSIPKKAIFGKELREKEATEEIVPVKTTKVARMDYKDIIISFGTIKGFGEIPIRFKESGVVSKFNFKEGDEIKEGEIVVSQDQRHEDLKLEYSKIEYDKNKKLHELGAIIEAKLRQAELELGSAELEVKKRNFYAPSDGLMGTRKVNEGELVEPNDVVATFLDISNVFCEVGIIEKDMGKVQTGQPARIILDIFPNEIFEGTVDSASPMIEGRSRTQTVRTLIPNERNLIKPGMFAKAEITTFEKKDAIVIPRKSLKQTEDGYVVFGIVKSEHEEEKSPAGFEMATAKVIPVKVGRASEELALITEGLNEGQEILLESPKAKGSIEDGLRVEIIGSE
jgi:membrane fusion protein (multidrug efflux system)